jgi:hypothetical protein
MKITVELSDNDLKDVMRFSGETKKGTAIRKFIVSELMLKRRREISRQLSEGKWGAELPSIEELRRERNVWRR